jgi:hypothetical protein
MSVVCRVMEASRGRPTLADYNAAFTARADRHRARTKVLRELAGMASIVMVRRELLQMAEERESLAESIEGLRFRDD